MTGVDLLHLSDRLHATTEFTPLQPFDFKPQSTALGRAYFMPSMHLGRLTSFANIR
jgi:hypothetical protein